MKSADLVSMPIQDLKKWHFDVETFDYAKLWIVQLLNWNRSLVWIIE
jgi:hypothetical protein